MVIMLKQKLLIFIFLVLLSQHALAEKPKLKVGLILPLSGFLSDYGTSSKNFVDMAFEDYPELKDSVEVIYEDSAYDTKVAITAYRKLVSSDRVDVVYAFGAKMLEGIAPLAERDNIPFFSAEMDGNFASKYSTTFMFINDIGEFSRVMLAGIRERGYKKFLLIKNENQFHNTWVNGIIKNTKEGETAIDYLSVLPGTTDFRTNLLKLKKEKFDALGLFLLPGTQRALVSQLSAFKLKYSLFGGDCVSFKEENKGYYHVVEGALTTALYMPESFTKRYVDKYGYNSSITFSVQAYRFPVLMGYISKSLGEDSTVNTGKILELSKNFTPALMKALNPDEAEQVMSYTFKTSAKQDQSSSKSFSFPIANYEIKSGEMVLKNVFRSPE